jgi:hypothetical protein
VFSSGCCGRGCCTPPGPAARRGLVLWLGGARWHSAPRTVFFGVFAVAELVWHSATLCSGPPREGADYDERGLGWPEKIRWVCVHTGGCNGSTVEHELALRPGFSTQVRMPPTALLAPRGGRRGLLVLTAGLVQYFYRRYTTGPVVASLPIERTGVLAPFHSVRT